jgi:hypothetical protein
MTEDDGGDGGDGGEDADAYREFGRERARTNGAGVEAAVRDLHDLLAEGDTERDVADYLEHARAVRERIPARYRAEFEGVAAALSVPEPELTLWTFAGGKAVTDLGGSGDDGADGEGCTNATVAARRAAGDAPLVLKNRDRSGRGLAPQSVLEAPSVGGRHGFLSVSTACHPFVFQGVNDAGLVAANSYVSRARESVPEAERLPNGVLVRRVLEECDSVAAARALVESASLERSKGLTLSVADAESAVLLEVDPQPAEVRVVEAEGGAVASANHFPGRSEDAAGTSSDYRLSRAETLLSDVADGVSVDDLFALARDHRNGPGPNSVCRHPSDEHGDPFVLSESTTLSTTVYRGGEPALWATVGNPCESRVGRYRLRGAGGE